MSTKNRIKIAKRRAFSLILCAALLLSMVSVSPASAAAEDYETTVEITNFTGDTTFYQDKGSEYEMNSSNNWSLLLHDDDYYNMSLLSDEDQERVKEGLDASALCLDKIIFKVKVTGEVQTPFTLMADIWAHGSKWGYYSYDSYTPGKHCTQEMATVSGPGEYEVVVTLDSDFRETTTSMIDGGLLWLSTVEQDSAITNPDAVIQLTGLTVEKADANASNLTALTAKIKEIDDLQINANTVIRKNSNVVTVRNNYIGTSQIELHDEYYVAKNMTIATPQDEVDAEVKKLTGMISTLVPAKDLWEACNEAWEYAEEDYTADSWGALDTAVNNALNIASDASVGDVATLKKAITDAIDGLVEIPYKLTELQSVLDSYSGRKEESYTAETWAAYKTARDNAQAVIDNPPADLVQDTVDELRDKLKEAAQAMVAADNTAARETLQSVVDQYSDYQEEVYTAESWAAFKKCLEAAQSAAKNTTMLIQDVNVCKENLQKAAEDLVEAPVIIKEDGVYLDYSGSWKKLTSANEMTGYVADGASAVLTTTESYWLDIRGIDLSELERPMLAVEYTGNGDTLQITSNTTGTTGWSDDNTIITSETEGSGSYTVELSPDIKYLLLTSNATSLVYTRVKIYDASPEARSEAKKELNTVVDSVNNYKQSDYTANSWATLQKALEDAKAVAEAETSTVAAINQAQKALEDAIKGLVKVTSGGNGTGGNSTGGTTTVGLKKNAKATVGNLIYKVTKTSVKSGNKTTKGTVTVTGMSKKGKKAKKLSVPATVKAGGATYKVTAIGAKAMKGSVATSVTLGKNVKSIAKNSFASCKKLSKLAIKAKLTTVKKNAFKGCKKKIKVSGKSKKQNLAKLKKSGYKKFK